MFGIMVDSNFAAHEQGIINPGYQIKWSNFCPHDLDKFVLCYHFEQQN